MANDPIRSKPAPTDRGWSDYWENEGAEGEVFVDSKGQKHPALATFWQGVFAALDDGARVIDVASGAGSIFNCIMEPARFQLCAADISEEALAILRERTPGVHTDACSATQIPQADKSFDRVVSQFGIEYAGSDAFAEAARLVAPGGKLVALCHYKDGYIDGRNAAQLAGAETARDQGFIEKAIALTHAAYRDDREKQQLSAKAFIPAERALAAAVAKQQDGIHAHLYAGFRRLYENRGLYAESDITGWLTQVGAEIDKFIYRVSNIRRVAQSRDDTDQIAEILAAGGLGNIACTPFSTPGNELPIAWKLTAERGTTES